MEHKSHQISEENWELNVEFEMTLQQSSNFKKNGKA